MREYIRCLVSALMVAVAGFAGAADTETGSVGDRRADIHESLPKPRAEGSVSGDRSEAAEVPVELPPPAGSSAGMRVELPELDEVRANPFEPPISATAALDRSTPATRLELLATASGADGIFWAMLNVEGKVVVVGEGEAVDLGSGSNILSILRIVEGVVYARLSDRKEPLLLR